VRSRRRDDGAGARQPVRQPSTPGLVELNAAAALAAGEFGEGTIEGQLGADQELARAHPPRVVQGHDHRGSSGSVVDPGRAQALQRVGVDQVRLEGLQPRVDAPGCLRVVIVQWVVEGDEGLGVESGHLDPTVRVMGLGEGPVAGATGATEKGDAVATLGHARRPGHRPGWWRR